MSTRLHSSSQPLALAPKLALALTLALSSFAQLCIAQKHEPFKGNQTPSWEECIQSYKELDEASEKGFLLEFGLSDVGKDLHMFYLQSSTNDKWEKPTIMINNAIHPGEPCGVDASLMLVREFIEDYEWTKGVLNKVNICIIPMYNVGGALNRGCCSRANQNGPDEYGFRGNAQNLDLNRDFIKMDSQNAESFASIYREIDPDVFIDTHTTNGADYRYVMTMITTQPEKIGEPLGSYLKDKMEPELYKAMDKAGYPMTPYVNTLGRTPETGIQDFLETPRFSTGYAALFGTLGFTSEAHMFKAYEERVEATYHFLREAILYTAENGEEIITVRNEFKKQTAEAKSLPIRWELDTTVTQKFNFMGYKPVFEKSELTGKERLRYERSKPKDMEIDWYHTYKTSKEVELPAAYIIPFAYQSIVDRFLFNQVDFLEVKRDTVINAETYYIEDFSSPSSPYEGHYFHNKVKANSISLKAQIYENWYIVPTDQVANRYIVHTLEPESHDSFFTWNFFDSILQQKEWFSDYIFEEEAKELLESDPELKEEFELLKEDPKFADDHFAQLYFIYRNSPNYESTKNLYPILKIDQETLDALLEQ